MLDSSLVKNNPQLLVFVPLFYTVWSDSILTPSEVSTLEGLLTSQQWLTETERKFLLTYSGIRWRLCNVLALRDGKWPRTF